MTKQEKRLLVLDILVALGVAMVLYAIAAGINRHRERQSLQVSWAYVGCWPTSVTETMKWYTKEAGNQSKWTCAV